MLMEQCYYKEKLKISHCEGSKVNIHADPGIFSGVRSAVSPEPLAELSLKHKTAKRMEQGIVFAFPLPKLYSFNF